MKAIMLMYDSLNRRMLSPYGCDWVKTPNFDRLKERTVMFTKNYAGSMPCMPARRELHTGRLNFLHRSWGPVEPFDDSMPRLLKQNGVYTHLTTDHANYWEDGGATYHTKYSTYELHRGQEADFWKGQVQDPEFPEGPATVVRDPKGPAWRQHNVNRQFLQSEEDMPQCKTFSAGIDFIRRNIQSDNWFLHIESFDPHEPYFTPEYYKQLYPHEYDGPQFNWPPYTRVGETPEEVEHLRYEYAAQLSMCDHYLGQVMNIMDEFDMWKDTMLIVNTDHGILLGEHDWWAKCISPFYNEVANIPLFVWDPRSGRKNETCDQLTQTIDLAPTLLDYFNVPIPKDMLGVPLKEAIAENKPVREACLFGIFGGHVNCTDGRYVYMLAPNPDLGGSPYKGENLFNHTLMPTHIRSAFSAAELKNAVLAPPFSFTKGMPVLKTPGQIRLSTLAPQDLREGVQYKTMLFDLENDPEQNNPIEDKETEEVMRAHIVRLMRENDAPPEQYQRMGLKDRR